MAASVTLRWRLNKDKSKTAYLDIYDSGKRRKKFIDIRIKTSDSNKSDQKKKAKAIATKFHNDLLNRKYELVSEDMLDSCFILYFQDYLDNYKKAGKRKFRYSYEKFLVYLKSIGRIKSILPSSQGKREHSLIPKNNVLKFRDLTYTLCNAYKEYLYSPESKLSGETPYDYFVRFRTVVNSAVSKRYLIESPLKEIKLKKPASNLKKQILTDKELQVLANTHCGNSEVKRAFLFACFTGLGEAEIRRMTWKNVADKRLNIKRSKTAEEMSSKLPSTAIKLLGDYGKADAKIFTLPSDVAVGKTLKSWVKKAKIDKHISFYCGRHTFAVMNLRNGVNLKTISKLLGHTSTAPTNKYLNYLDEEKDKAMENLVELTF